MNTVPSQPFWTIVQPGGEEPPAPLATNDELLALLPGTYYMDPPDGGSVTVLEQLQRMAADAARYRERVARIRPDDVLLIAGAVDKATRPSKYQPVPNLHPAYMLARALYAESMQRDDAAAAWAAYQEVSR